MEQLFEDNRARMDKEQANAQARDDFIRRMGKLTEPSPWVPPLWLRRPATRRPLGYELTGQR
jgi:2-oxo-4-hydroxy-4-carboxy--5-ureidoimidazoline (OHCU) decarboxylase